MRKNHSNWREDLREVVDIESSEPETEEKSEVKIGDKKVTNKITINPVMKEAFGEIGALVIEVTELEEGDCGDDKEKKKRDIENLQNDKDTKEGRKPGKLNTEAMSVADQMRVSAQHWKKNPRKPYKPGDGYARNVKDAARNAARKPKDTRTPQQRMNDAVGKSRAGESD